MTREQFRTEVVRRLRRWPEARLVLQPSEETDVNGWLNIWLQDVTRETLVLYRTSCAMTLTAGVAEYSLQDAVVFERPMLDVQVMTVNKFVLRNLSGNVSEEDPALLAIYNPTYQDDSDGPPARYFASGPETIILQPAPDDEYEAYVVGYGLHYAMSSDSDVLEIPARLIEDAADYCAMRWLGQSNDLALYANEWQRVTSNFASMRATEVGRSILKRPRGDTGRRVVMTGATRWPL